MASLTNYLTNALLDHVLRNVPYSSPDDVYLALFTTATDATGAGTEVAGGDYARQLLVFNVAGDPGDPVRNGDNVTFDGMPAATVTHVAIFDDPDAGHMLFQAEMVTPKTVATGDTLTFAPGDIEVALA